MRRAMVFRVVRAVCAGVALACLTPLASARQLTLPSGTVIVEATGPGGAPYAFDDTGVTCTPSSGSTFRLGRTTVDCGPDGSFVVRVVDTTPPVVTPPGDVTVTTGDPGGATVSYGAASATDAVAGSPPVICTPASGSNFGVGTTVVTCSASDGENTGTATFNVTVNLVDTTAPTLSVPSQITAEATGPGGTAVTFSVSASDLVDPSPVISCDHSSGDTFPLGTTGVTCSARDASNNVSGSQSFNVTVADTTAPTFNSIPSGTITLEAAGASGSSYSFTVTATDAVSASPVISCTHGPSAETYPLGTTPVSCTATDAAGNPRTESFDVRVADTIPPTVSVPGPITKEATGPSGAVVTFSVTAADAIDPAPTVTCNHASGSTFAVGTTLVSCTATDASGNPSPPATFEVKVGDTIAPTVSVPGPITKEATGPSGAVATFSVNATDAIDPAPSVSCNHTSGSTFPLGTTLVSCTATDASNNTSTPPQSFNVSVKDTTAPDIATQADVSAEATGPSGASVSYPTVTASDAVDGTIAATCLPSSGATFPLGASTVTCNATDAHGNHATPPKSFTITVVDTTAPAVAGRSAITVEANSPLGSTVNFPPMSAVDLVDGPVALLPCVPASGTTFPLGTTTVTCSATDAHGNTGTASFQVTVADTTPPNLTVPQARSVYATTPTGIPKTDPAVVYFLTAASATDIADPHPVVSTNEPKFLPVGTLTVEFIARDASGNSTSQTVLFTVLPQPPAGTPPLPIPPAPKPPPEVQKLAAKPLDHAAQISWQMPPEAKEAIVTRFTNTARALSAARDGEIVYRGPGSSYVDRGLQNGVEYRYVVVTVDAAGNRSAGVAIVVFPRRDLLRSPKDEARLRKAPRLVWTKDPQATYYNVQLLLNGVKILSVWPTTPALTLHKSWKYQGRQYTLKPGVYQWYVWPGYGPRSDVNYGELLGARTFRIVR